jgi:hypothetical protein
MSINSCSVKGVIQKKKKRFHFRPRVDISQRGDVERLPHRMNSVIPVLKSENSQLLKMNSAIPQKISNVSILEK